MFNLFKRRVSFSFVTLSLYLHSDFVSPLKRFLLKSASATGSFSYFYLLLAFCCFFVYPSMHNLLSSIIFQGCFRVGRKQSVKKKTTSGSRPRPVLQLPRKAANQSKPGSYAGSSARKHQEWRAKFQRTSSWEEERKAARGSGDQRR